MALALNGLFGKITGKIGDFSVRNINGKTVIAARPKHFKMSMTPQCVNTRQKFAVTSAFSKVVSGLPALNAIWNPKKAATTTARQVIFKSNFNLSSAQSPTVNNVITPNGSYWSPVMDVSINQEKLTGSLEPFNEHIEIAYNETKVSINAVVCLIGPKEATDNYYSIFSLSKEVAEFDFSKQYDFEIDLTPEKWALIAKYNQNIIYLAVATKSTDNKIFHYSKPYSKISE
jgi:hypothetical protein